MLQRMGRPDYHTYRSPYFDWRREIQEGSGVKFEDILVENRLGFTNYSSGFPVVSGLLAKGWETVCARMLGQICDPNIPTGPIQRCPVPDRCLSSNPDWPTLERINRAISFETFDAAPWNEISSDGFRSFVDFEIGSDPKACRNDRMCLCEGGDINCTSPAIAAGSPVVTLASRIHTTVSVNTKVLWCLYVLFITLCHWLHFVLWVSSIIITCLHVHAASLCSWHWWFQGLLLH